VYQMKDEVGERGGPRGDLYILIYVKKHEIFKRDDNNVLCDVPISFTQATLGAEVSVPTLYDNVKMKIPSGNSKVVRYSDSAVKA